MIKLRYSCRWCKESFESDAESLDYFSMRDRVYQMHCCNESAHVKYPDVIILRYGLGDLVGYEIVGDTK